MKTKNTIDCRQGTIASFCALLLATLDVVLGGSAIDPTLKGAWPAYGPANAKGVAVDGGFA